MAHSFFKQAFEGNNKWWTFLVGILLVIAGHSFGQIPISVLLVASMTKKMGSTGLVELNERMAALDFAYFGIDQNLAFFLILLSFATAMFALWFAMRKIHRRPFMSLIADRDRLDWSRIMFGFSLWLGLSIIGELVSYFLDPGNYTFSFAWQSFIPLLLICLLILPIQTSFEELFVRGYLLQGLTLRPGVIILVCLIAGGLTHSLMVAQVQPARGFGYLLAYLLTAAVVGLLFYLENKGTINLNLRKFMARPIVPLLLTSLVFGVLHGMNPEVAEFGMGKMMVFYIGTGLFLGLVTLLDESLEIALGIHFANNLYGALFLSFDGSALQTPTLFRVNEISTEYMISAWLLMVGLFMLVAMFKYRWVDWGKLLRSIDYSQWQAQGLAEVEIQDSILPPLDEGDDV